MTAPRPAWGGRRAQRLTAAVLARDEDPDLGYTPCRWCGHRATTADHWPIARADGGPDTLDNLVPACRPCNTARGVAFWEQRRRPPLPSRSW
jgi:5-methylcytosine-specific restriction endonuclease McrA